MISNILIEDIITRHLFEKPSEFEKNILEEFNDMAEANETGEIYELENFHFPELTFTLKIRDAFKFREKSFDIKKHIVIKNVDIKIV